MTFKCKKKKKFINMGSLWVNDNHRKKECKQKVCVAEMGFNKIPIFYTKLTTPFSK